ncbi:MAG: hypothetical protein NDI60_06745 [Elusimicrobiales bacterium]|nr:hypothetical protein [Elusimicrobiales bacterium]
MTRARGAAAWLLAVLAAAAALAAAALLAFYPPPATFSLLYPPQSSHVRAGRFARQVCNGVQCRLCPYDCFLPEGATGRCRVRVNCGGSIKTLVYPQSAAAKTNPI